MTNLTYSKQDLETIDELNTALTDIFSGTWSRDKQQTLTAVANQVKPVLMEMINLPSQCVASIKKLKAAREAGFISETTKIKYSPTSQKRYVGQVTLRQGALLMNADETVHQYLDSLGIPEIDEKEATKIAIPLIEKMAWKSLDRLYDVFPHAMQTTLVAQENNHVALAPLFLAEVWKKNHKRNPIKADGALRFGIARAMKDGLGRISWHLAGIKEEPLKTQFEAALKRIESEVIEKRMEGSLSRALPTTKRVRL